MVVDASRASTRRSPRRKPAPAPTRPTSGSPCARCTGAWASTRRRRRPSSEALLRRVRKGSPFPGSTASWTSCNWCSLEFQLPYGLYDLAHVRGAHRRCGSAATARAIPASARTTCTWPDASRSPTTTGPFGNPTSDSARTMVTPRPRATRCWSSSRPRNWPPTPLRACVDTTAAAGAADSAEAPRRSRPGMSEAMRRERPRVVAIIAAGGQGRRLGAGRAEAVPRDRRAHDPRTQRPSVRPRTRRWTQVVVALPADLVAAAPAFRLGHWSGARARRGRRRSPAGLGGERVRGDRVGGRRRS